jgi:glycosyltransferase involved in cell wall biosynthesis
MSHTVVQFLDSNTYGGCEEVVSTLLAGLDRDRWQPILFHHDEPGINRLVVEAARLGIPSRVVPRITGHGLAGLRNFHRELVASKATIFHAHLNWPLGCRHGILAARLGRVPKVVATSHLYFPLKDVRFAWVKQRLQMTALDRYVAVSDEVKNRLQGDLGVSSAKVSVVHNGIRLGRFEQPFDPAFRTSIAEGTARRIVFTPARLHGQKGHDYLLEAAANVPEALFLLAGDGPERERLERKAQDLDIAERVRFLGERHDVARLLVHCDLFVLPSLYEGLPLTVLEAMAAGKPVVATSVGGTDEAVLNDITGLLVAPANPERLAAAINALLSDPDRASRLAAAGQTRVRQMFSAETMVRGVESVYEELLRPAGIT